MRKKGEHMEKRIIYSTYESLHNAFKECTDLSDTTMKNAMQEMIQLFIKDELNIDSLQKSLIKAKENLLLSKEKRDSKVTIAINSELYDSLKSKLAKSGHMRPATLLTYLTAFYIEQRDIREMYAKHAKYLIDHSEDSIQHIIYGIEYRHPLDSKIFKHSEYFIECCTEDQFTPYEKADRECSFISVLSVHK